MIFSREILHDRHRLSHQQIDNWLGEKRSKDFMSEKLKQLERVKTFLHITDLLRQNKINFISIKGPLLSVRIYNDPTVRIFNDIDILIEESDIEKVIKILQENDFFLMQPSIWPHGKARQELFTKACKHLSLFNRKQNFCVEVHWVLTHGIPLAGKKIKKLLAENIAEFNYAGRNFTVLNKEFELLYLLMHGVKHGWSRLKWLIDIKDYPVAEMDIEKFNQLVKKFNAWRLIGQTNYLLKLLFDQPFIVSGETHLPLYFKNYALETINSEITEHYSPIELIQRYRYQWFVFTGFYHYKLMMIVRKIFLPENISVNSITFKFVYYLYIPYRFIKKIFSYAG